MKKPSEQLKETQFAALYEEMLANGDDVNAKKILELYEKMKNDEFIVSFAGHFSAGKSTMINHLLGEAILPESPIPTSANVVKLMSGDGVARVFFHHAEPIEYVEPYDMDMIKAYCKNKDTIKKMEISTKKPIVPAHTAIFDTPGIDAADDADRLITEASMHLVDVLFYVMDYNHVQSEVNLQFLHQLTEKELPFFVIINQIDKHDESELAFTTFTTSITDTFKLWDIDPEHIFYSSLVKQDAPHNDFIEIKKKLFSIMEKERDDYFSVLKSCKRVVHDYERNLTKDYDEQIQALQIDDQNQDDLATNLDTITKKLAQLSQTMTDMEDDFTRELNTSIENAYITPFDLREKAKAFLLSRQKDFKVGMFGSKKKTEQERQNRLHAFFDPLHEKIEALMEWKLRDKFAGLLQKYDIQDPKIVQLTQQLSVTYTEENVLSLVKTGAKVNGESVLNYTDDVRHDIKQKYKQQALSIVRLIMERVKKQHKKEEDQYRGELEQLEKTQNQMKSVQSLEKACEEKKQLVQDIIEGENVHPNLSLDQVLAENKITFQAAHEVEVLKKPDIKQQDMENDIQSETKEKVQSLETVLTSVKETVAAIQDLPGFQSIVDDLVEKQERLQNQSYTIALFGAFSAGKSTLANALLGDLVLPVSPNPTTAAINRICPVTTEQAHGTVVVNMKDESMLYEDLLAITKRFSPKQTDFRSLLDWVIRKEIQKHSGLKQVYQSYLQAMINGFSENGPFIGKQLQLQIDEFPSYVSDETKACFVESINLYYDCDFTKKGITLVDTPGADSVNSRHTNVAFDYIKHADALLYVTYFNHALSRADKDFLLQLGRVKESFQLDKMFFIVNACDLAKDEQELKLVTDYVEKELAQLGIRFPRLYPVSGKKALKQQIENEPFNPKMQAFVDAFYQFIREDLSQMTIQQIIMEIQHAKLSVINYIQSANLNEQERDAYRIKLKETQTMASDIIYHVEAGLYLKQTAQKIEKQLYYVLDRLSIRFHDMFKEMFNPTTITESGKKGMDQVKQNMDGLLDYTGYELLQELRAVSLRVEAYMSTLIQDVCKELIGEIQDIDENILIQQQETSDFITPDYEQAFTKLDHTTFQKALNVFKGTKAFFVKNEKEQMKEEIYLQLEPFAESYVHSNKDIMESDYEKQWMRVLGEVQQAAVENVATYVNQTLNMLNKPVDMDQLKQKEKMLIDITNRHK